MDEGNGGQGGAGGATTSRTLGQEGGEVVAGNVTLNFPAGAVPKKTEVTVTILDADAVDDLPATSDDVKLAGFPAKFTPHGLTFEQPVDVAVGFDPQGSTDTPLVAMKLDNDQDTTWEVVPGAKFENGEASFQITGFSFYAVFEDPSGVAKDLYGPNAQGSGGSGSGGVSSGGSDSGGSDSGGSSQGGSGGELASGGGGGGTPFGYLDKPTLHGHGFLAFGPGASIDSDLLTAPAPNCAWGSTGVDSGATATLGYTISESVTPGDNQPIFVSDQGLWIGVDWVTPSRPMLVELEDVTSAGAKWCAYVFGDLAAEFISWESFSTDCQGETGASFDPGNNQVSQISLKVLSTSQTEEFDFCVTELGTGGPPVQQLGYLPGPDWHGHGFAVTDGTSVVNTNLTTQAFPNNCADGTTGASPSAYGGLHYNVGQPYQGANVPVLLQGQGVRVNVNWDEVRPLYVQMTSITSGANYCAPIAGSGTRMIPKEAFTTECTGGGSPLPGGVLINSVGILAPSTTVLDDPFAFCVSELRPELGGAPLPNGYLSNAAWHGYGFEETGPGATMSSNLLSSQLPNCASGSTSSDPGSSAALFYAVNESQVGGDSSPILLTQNGVWVAFNGSPRQYVVKLLDDTQLRSWCAPLPGTGAAFVPWGSFSDDCADPPSGVPPVPGVDQIDAVGVVALSTGQAQGYDFCVHNLQAMAGPPPPPGYLNGPDWFGDGMAFADTNSTLTHDLGNKPAPNCIWGQTDASPSAWASLHYNVAQPVSGPNDPIFMTGDGVAIGIDTPDSRPLQVEVYSIAAGATFCALLPAGSGSYMIPWTAFNDACWTTGGTQFVPSGLLIDEIGITVRSTGVQQSYDVCVTELQQYTVVPG